jgi:hypothetical protein
MHSPNSPHHTLYFHQSDCVQPPADIVTRETLTEADLKWYGLPMRSQFSSQTDWKREVEAVKTRVCDTSEEVYDDDGSPVYVNGPPHTGKQSTVKRPNNPGNTLDYSVLWSGYMGNSWFVAHDAVSANINIPCIQGRDWGPTGMSQWVGQSGYGGNGVLQAGVSELQIHLNNIANLFYENTAYLGHNGEIDWEKQVPWCGQSTNVYVYVSGNYVNEVDNVTGHSIALLWGPAVPGDSAEYIVEHNGQNSGQNLTQFDYANFDHCMYMDNSGNWWALDADPSIVEYVLTSDGTPNTHQLVNFGWYYYFQWGDSYDSTWANGA